MLESESTACPICGAFDVRSLYAGDGFEMGRCRTCGLVRQEPRITEASMRTEVYDTGPGPLRAGRRLHHDDLPDWLNKPLEAYAACVEAVEAVRDGGERGPWVDVGASTGALLVTARDRGWPVAGAELSSAAVALCRERHDLDVRVGTLHEAAFPEGYAEVVSYRQVLEHVHDLAGELAEVRRVLHPGGLILVEVPHYGGIKFRIDRVRGALPLAPSPWRHRNIPEHLYYFRRRDLETLLDRAGFEMLSARTYGRYHRKNPWHRRLRHAVRDGLVLGNKIRVVARRR